MIKKLCMFCYVNTAYSSKRSIPVACDECIIKNAQNWKVS